MLVVTAVVASLLGFLQVRLSFAVIRLRRSLKISVGDGGNESLLRAIRAQANLVEYGPLSLILLACLELNGAPWWLCVVFGIVLLLGRWLHQQGIVDDSSSFSKRVLGMQLTLGGLIALGITNLVWLIWRTLV